MLIVKEAIQFHSVQLLCAMNVFYYSSYETHEREPRIPSNSSLIAGNKITGTCFLRFVTIQINTL